MYKAASIPQLTPPLLMMRTPFALTPESTNRDATTVPGLAPSVCAAAILTRSLSLSYEPQCVVQKRSLKMPRAPRNIAPVQIDL